MSEALPLERHFEPVRSERAHEAVARQLRNALLSGRLREGERLPNERQLTESMGVSRSAVRQALLLLQQQGLVEVRVGQAGGAFVKRSGFGPVLQAFENLLFTQGVTVEQYLAAKRALEPAIIDGVVEHVTAQQLAALEDNISSMQRALAIDSDDDVDLLDSSMEFHEILASATGNSVLEALLRALIQIADRLPGFHSGAQQDWNAVIVDHQAIVDTLRRGSAADLAAVLRNHVDFVESTFGDSPA